MLLSSCHEDDLRGRGALEINFSELVILSIRDRDRDAASVIPQSSTANPGKTVIVKSVKSLFLSLANQAGYVIIKRDDYGEFMHVHARIGGRVTTLEQLNQALESRQAEMIGELAAAQAAIAQAHRELELTRAAAAQATEQAQQEVALTRAAAAQATEQAQQEVALTRAAAAEAAAQAQRELELTRAAATQAAEEAQHELELTRAAVKQNFPHYAKRQLTQEQLDTRIAVQQLERELELARTEVWQARQELAACREDKEQVQMELTDAASKMRSA